MKRERKRRKKKHIFAHSRRSLFATLSSFSHEYRLLSSTTYKNPSYNLKRITLDHRAFCSHSKYSFQCPLTPVCRYLLLLLPLVVVSSSLGFLHFLPFSLSLQLSIHFLFSRICARRRAREREKKIVKIHHKILK